MEKVTGIGGFFFHSNNPTLLNDWYEKHLGVRQAGKEYEDGSWWQDEGPTVFGGEPAGASMASPEKSWRINFRVHNLDAMVAQLRAAGISVEAQSDVFPNGRFAHLHDPDGNAIELWENGGTDAGRPSESIDPGYQTTIPTLQAHQVILSPFVAADAPLVQQYAGAPEIARMTQNVPHPYPDGGAEKWIATHSLEYLQKKNVVFAVRSQGGQLMGAIHLSLRLSDRIAEMGYWIGLPFWGRGVCTAAARRLIQYGFEEWNLNKIYARHLGGNIASGRVMEKAGMKKEGIQRHQVIKNGVSMDIVEYGILQSEYAGI